MEMTLEQKRALALAQARLRAEQESQPAPSAPAAPKPSVGSMLADEAYNSFVRPALNLGAGALRGAGSIGATILAPIDAAARAVGIQNDYIGRTDRREAMTEGLRSMGADPDSLSFKGGKLGAEIAGTAAVPGMLASRAAAAGASPVLVQALRTAGMSAGGATGAGALGARVLGGATAGGVSAGIVNPEDAGTGALIGGGLPVAGQVLKAAVTAGRNALGATTGAGEQALKTAYESGKAGGAQGQAFKDNMRGNVPLENVLDDARANLGALRTNRANAYNANMGSVRGNQSVLNVAPIEQSIDDALKNFTFKGQVKNQGAYDALTQARAAVENWKKLDPAQYHTPEGMDALKQQIGGILDDLKPGTPAASAVRGVYNSVKKEIESQAPEYSKAMKDYSQASDVLDDVVRTLSLGDKAAKDTTMRKLQSVLRNNVNTNYGQRQALVEVLEQAGGRDLQTALAGQALNNWAPRGLQVATAPGLSLGAGAVAGIPAAAGAAAISSPRLMGEAAYLAGQANPIVEALRRLSYRTAPVAAAD